ARDSTLLPYTTLFRSSKPPNRDYDQEGGDTAGIDWMERIVSTRRSGQRGGFETTPNAHPAETIRSGVTMSSLNRKFEYLIYRNRSEEHTSELQSRENL